MRRILALAGLALAVCAAAAEQGSPGRVVIPGRTGAGPRTVELSLVHASVTVRTHASKDVIAEAAGAAQYANRTVGGMRRIDVPREYNVTAQEQGDTIHVQAPMRPGGQSDVILTVPVETSLSLKTVHGNIVVEGVHGEIDATSTHGTVTLTGVSGTVVASAAMGSLKVSMERVDAVKPLSFSTLNGTIDVTFPANVKTSLKLKADRGQIWSDFDINLSNSRPDGLRRLDSAYSHNATGTIYGTINGGGVEASFHTVNGKILIHKKQ